MALNFNVDPYYDDFDPAKNFHRVLFKPGYAVQARELTQAQSILQDQVTKFADNIFKQNSPVTGGQVTTNFDVYYIKLKTTFNDIDIDVTNWEGLLVQNATGTVIARVVQIATPTGTATAGDPPTLIVAYKTGSRFGDSDIIYDVASNSAVQAIDSGSTGKSSVASVAEGVFYVEGHFVQVNPQTVIVEKYSNTPSRRIGLNITETIYDYINDNSLLDPAIGSTNYQAPGADRYVIQLTLETRPIQFGDDNKFIELVRVTDGSVAKMLDGSVYNVIDDYFAKRNYETNGDFVIDNFKLTPKPNPDDTNSYILSVGKGLAYVHGYRVESPGQIDIVSNRARTTDTRNNGPVFVDYGSYMYVDYLRGNTSSSFDTTVAQKVELHCVLPESINTSSNGTYAATTIATGYIRGLAYDTSSNTANANTYVYKAFLYNLESKAPSANAAAGGTNTIQLASSYSTVNDAYKGVNISIVAGPGRGEVRTISAYDGATRTAQVNRDWTVQPTTASVYVLNFDVKDTESIVTVDSNRNIDASARINVQGKTDFVSTGDALLENTNSSEMIFKVGNFVSSITDSSYTTQQVWRNISFTSTGSGVSAELNYQNAYDGVFYHFGTPSSVLSSSTVLENYVVMVTDKGSNTLIKNGDIVPWVTAGRTVTLDNDASIATFDATDLLPFTATIIAKVYVQNADNTGFIRKFKNLITANLATVNISGTQVGVGTYVDDTSLTSTGQVYITKAGLVTPGQKQSLYLSDVKRIVKIIDTQDANVAPTTNMLLNTLYDVTSNFTFDNGQRDGFYDHASIALKPGAAAPKGNILVYVDYYQHTGGDGYFSVASYTNSTLQEEYRSIPSYKSTNGTVYSLRDCLDFRPARQNAQVDFIYRYSSTGPQNYGLNLPTDLSVYYSDYSYYLGRKDKLVLSKDRKFEIIEGVPSLDANPPEIPDGALLLATITHAPYTGYVASETPVGLIPDLSLENTQYRRYTFKDISRIDNRLNRIEYYTSLNLLEQKASALQISDTYGLNRFKNGILVDDFSSYATADTTNTDYNSSINRRDRVLSATQNVKNFPLKSALVVENLGQLASSVTTGLDYKIHQDGQVKYFSLPYTTSNVASQKFASRTVNVNPFSFIDKEGVVDLTPNIDNWVDTDYAPSILVVDPDLQIFSETPNTVNVLTAGDWKAIPGTTTTKTTTQTTTSGQWQTTTVTSDTYQNQTQTNILGTYQKINNTYALNNEYITDISVMPYVRAQEVVVSGRNMLLNTSVDAYFDTQNVNKYFRKANIIELAGVTGTFNAGDVIGYFSSGTFYPTGRVIYAYQKTSTTTRLYVAGDGTSTSYTTNGTLKSAVFNSGGSYVTSPASGTLVSSQHYGGMVRTANSSTKIQLSGLASTTEGYYVGNTIYINSGTGAGQSATITTYYGANQSAVLSSSVTTTANAIYSMGDLKTDETGAIHGVFIVPTNTFHTGQRIFRFDDSNGNAGAETTFAQGTFYSEGLQATAQKVNFGASPAGASGTFVQTNYANNVLISSSSNTAVVRIQNTYDPVAQTFMVDKDNFPNGTFIISVKFFFKNKPTTDNSPITLSIVGTLNGYPNGQTLDHSIVTLNPTQVTVSDNPQYLDSTTYTEFTFSVPIYIQPGTLYAFILKSNSNEYVMWSAATGDIALKSSCKNLPSDPIPSNVTKIGTAPYIGSLFISQNAQTWTTDQNQSLMFVLDRCVFTTTASPTIQYVVPKGLPQRNLFEQSIEYFKDANNTISSSTNLTPKLTNNNTVIDALNFTTTDFIPSTASVQYSYKSTLKSSNTATSNTSIVPGKYGTPSADDIYLGDGNGQRILLANTSNSLSMFARLATKDAAVSPIISDAGLSAYTIKWNINNCEITNSHITISNSGNGYTQQTTTVTFSAPTGGSGAVRATGNVVVSGGQVTSVYITNPGAGYIETPTATISDANGTPGTGATVIVAGETSKSGGNALARYVTKKVVLDAGFDSGDLIVYMSAYRPVGTDIHVYYKILNRNDSQPFNDSSWQLMTKINSSGSKYSKDRTDIIEYSFAPGTGGIDQGFVSYTSSTGQVYTSFSQFAIKVVLTSTDNTFVPFATDIRAIALPANVNPVF